VDPKDADESLEHLKKSEIFGGHDGMGALIDAIKVTSEGDGRPHHSRSTSFVSAQPSLANTRNASTSQMGFSGFGSLDHRLQDIKPFGLGGFDAAAHNGSANAPDAAYERATKAWNRLRFVRAGLFTAKEGMEYIHYFYQFLYPLTPIRIPSYNEPSMHTTLLENEPMLLVTILTITSRYMKLSGSGGEHSRPSVIHDKLWTYLRGMIERTIWAQEQFGGGFCGAGAEATRRIDPFSQKGLRTLGTVESFMLLTEWHPRALHFPPGDDDDELLIPVDPQEPVVANGESPLLFMNAPVGQRRDSWLEPCWRSDRMCWMLLSYALSLAFEIGVFEQIDKATFRALNPGHAEEKVNEYFIRKTHLKELLWIYYVQTSGRLELISRLPKGFLESLHQTEADARIQQLVHERIANIQQNPNRLFSPTTLTKDFVEDPHEITLNFWEEIAAIMKSGNQQLFLNREHTRRIIRNGDYAHYLDVYQPLLRDWRKEFDRCTTSELCDHQKFDID